MIKPRVICERCGYVRNVCDYCEVAKPRERWNTVARAVRPVVRVGAWRVPNEDGAELRVIAHRDCSRAHYIAPDGVIYRGRARFTDAGLTYVRPAKGWP